MHLSSIFIFGSCIALCVNQTFELGLQSGVFLHKRALPSRMHPHLQKPTKRNFLQKPPDSVPRRPNSPFPDAATQTKTPVSPPLASESGSQTNTRTNAFIRIKIYAYFQECHGGVRIHVQKITDICAERMTKESVQQISWALLAELQAILALCLRCVSQIKSCRQAPVPSSIPGVPRASPSVHDVGGIIFQLLLQLKICFQKMNQVCSKYDIIRAICQDCLVKISFAVSSCLLGSNAQIGGVLSVVTQMCGGNPASFFGLKRWGLDSIIKILQQSL